MCSYNEQFLGLLARGKMLDSNLRPFGREPFMLSYRVATATAPKQRTDNTRIFFILARGPGKVAVQQDHLEAVAILHG